MRIILFICILVLFHYDLRSQHHIEGIVLEEAEPIAYAKVKIASLKAYAITDEKGRFTLFNVPSGTFSLEVFAYGYENFLDSISIPSESVKIKLKPLSQEINEVVVSGTLEEVSKKESAVNVEVYNAKFFKKNPTSSVYDALQNVYGVRPQLNCNICNTGDIHINGLEGAYTMVLIDGMPIVSSLSTVYGLFGIPTSIIERVEIVKGPASTLYGSEAVGGVINIITKTVQNAPLLAVDAMTNSWLETNADISFKAGLGKKSEVLSGINYFNYSLPIDNNDDGFTDLTLQHRLSMFQKWNFKRKHYRIFSLAGRYLYEDRWGGQTNWTPEFRGGDSIYGESIYTNRWELIGKYQLPFKEKVIFTGSLNKHHQNSYYGTTSFIADQVIAFGQFHWTRKINRHQILGGLALRYTYYDDNTTSTETGDSIIVNEPSKIILPGIFLQDDWKLTNKHKALMGIRFDYNSIHGVIITPRVGYKWTPNFHSTIRLNAGTGYRVVNIYTEDHAALTGAREVVIMEGIDPETSYNLNLNYSFDFITKKDRRIIADLTGFYTYFSNKIITDYDSDPNMIFYYNSPSYAIDKGISLNLTFHPFNSLRMQGGISIIDLAYYDNQVKKYQVLTEKLTGTWSISYNFKKNFSFDYTGNVYSPMRLPLLNPQDPRPAYSPWWSIQNIQITYKGVKNWEFYSGVKNLLDWTPGKAADFIIARSHDPFDKMVQFDSSGNAIATPENPYALTFDPSYVYAPNQGARIFFGIRYTFRDK